RHGVEPDDGGDVAGSAAFALAGLAAGAARAVGGDRGARALTPALSQREREQAKARRSPSQPDRPPLPLGEGWGEGAAPLAPLITAPTAPTLSVRQRPSKSYA